MYLINCLLLSMNCSKLRVRRVLRVGARSESVCPSCEREGGHLRTVPWGRSQICREDKKGQGLTFLDVLMAEEGDAQGSNGHPMPCQVTLDPVGLWSMRNSLVTNYHH